MIRKLAQNLKIEKLPTFFIVGAQKSGTTFLANFLNLHLSLQSSPIKETDFFTKDILYNQGLDYYKTYFKCFPFQQTFDASVNYMYTPQVAKRLYEYQPDTKIIILMRNPIERAFSAWNMFERFYYDRKEIVIKDYFNSLNEPAKSDGIAFLEQAEFPRFNECIKKSLAQFALKPNTFSEPGILERGLYMSQINNLLQFFEKEQLLFIPYDDLINDFENIVTTTSNFLGVKLDANKAAKAEKNTGNYQRRYDKSTESLLKSFYKTENEALENFLNRSLNW